MEHSHTRMDAIANGAFADGGNHKLRQPQRHPQMEELTDGGTHTKTLGHEGSHFGCGIHGIIHSRWRHLIWKYSLMENSGMKNSELIIQTTLTKG